MGKKRKKQDTVSVSEFLGQGITCIYLVLIMGVFPIYYPGTLIGLQAVKTTYFHTIAIVYVCLMAVISAGRGIAFFKEKRKIKMDACDICMAIFTVAVLVSTVVALDREKAFFGNSNIRTGATVMLLCIASYYAVKSYAKFGRILIWTNLIASALIHISCILITCQMDLVGMQADIMDGQKSAFVSPIGNIDYNVSYVSLIFPAAMAMFLLVKEAFMKRILMGYLYIGFVNIFCLRTESAIVLTAFAFSLLLYFALEKVQYFQRYLLMVQIFLASNISVYLLKTVLQDRMYGFDGMGALLLRPEIIICEAVLLGLSFWIQKIVSRQKDERIIKLQKIYGIIYFAAIAAVAALFAGANLFKNAVAETPLAGFIIHDSMFTLRGYIWTRSMEVFFKQPIINQIFGCGLACFYDMISPFYGEEMIAMFDGVYYEPHNDFLWILTTTGIVGAVGFFGSVIAMFQSSLKERKNRNMQIMAVMSIASFLVQGLVNSYTIFVIPLVFIIMGLAYVSPEEENLWR